MMRLARLKLRISNCSCGVANLTVTSLRGEQRRSNPEGNIKIGAKKAGLLRFARKDKTSRPLLNRYENYCSYVLKGVAR